MGRRMLNLAVLGAPVTAGGGQTYAAWVQERVSEGAVPLWYQFNETSGTTVVNYGSAGAALDGTLSADDTGAVLGATGPMGEGHAYDVSPANNVEIAVPQHVSLTGMTDQAWVWLINLRSSGEDGNGSFGRYALTATRWNFVLSANYEIKWDYASTDARVYAATPSSGWRGLVYGLASNAPYIRYMASGSVSTPAQTATPGTGGIVAPTDDLTLCNNGINTSGLDAVVDELIVFDRPLTDAEYSQLAGFFA